MRNSEKRTRNLMSMYKAPLLIDGIDRLYVSQKEKCCIVTTITNYTNTYACRIITTTQYRRATQFVEKYTSHFIWKVCVWEGIGDRTELKHIDPHSISHNHVSFPFSWAAQPGAWGPSLSAGCWLSLLHLVTNWSGLQTNWLPVFIELYNSSTSPSSCGRHNCTHSTRPWSSLYSDILWANAPVIYIGAFPILTARLGRRSIYNRRKWTRWIWGLHNASIQRLKAYIKIVTKRLITAVNESSGNIRADRKTIKTWK